ncbi:MAG: tetratricopeptide repeat protein [Oscillochloris sp.]|nr:tetratricopeptide repeat protein [Oscillochloris sp.]
MRLRVSRRPEIFFLAAMLALAVAALLRLGQAPAVGPVAIDLAAPAPIPRDLGDPQMIEQLQAYLRANPDDSAAYANLGLALLQRVRDTGDPALYTQAEEAFAAALQRDPHHLDALVGQGVLALARHQFQTALEWGERAREVAPLRAVVYGLLGDAYVELGRYDEAVAAIQQMVDIRPDLNSYSRVAYVRELYGDVDGAITAMEQALDAGAAGGENSLWVRVQLANLWFNRGDPARAEAQYLIALAQRADYPYALEGLARVRAAQGQASEAIAIYRELVDRLPLPQFVIGLGELYAALGDQGAAAEQFRLAEAMQQLSASAGVAVDLELALFAADHGDNPAAALRLAQAAYTAHPGIYAADALAWAFYHSGDYVQAARYSAEALRLNTRDANLYFHAGMIAYAGADHAAAREYLQTALAINPHFSPLRAAQAHATLEELR